MQGRDIEYLLENLNFSALDSNYWREANFSVVSFIEGVQKVLFCSVILKDIEYHRKNLDKEN